MPRSMSVIRTERTLVKSPPELWELVDDPDLMLRWTAEICGGSPEAGVETTEREPERRLEWRRGEGPRISLTLAEKGWGTKVSIEAECGGLTESGEDVLERLLDELGSPTRRPFARN
jgi:uncharacterized protein YndB with AHSA1/START domain